MLGREARAQCLIDKHLTSAQSLVLHIGIFKLYFEVGDLDSCSLMWSVFLVEFKKNVELFLTFVGLLEQDSNVFLFLFVFSRDAGYLDQSPCQIRSMPQILSCFLYFPVISSF